MEATATKICLNKACLSDGRPMLISNFGVHNGNDDGLNKYCKLCAHQKVIECRKRVREYRAVAPAGTKVCPHPTCERAGQALRLSAFGINLGRPDGLSVYCKQCQREIMRRRRAEAKKAIRRQTPETRVCRALESGPLQFRELAKKARLSQDELSALLPYIHGREPECKILSKNGTGPRVYFLKPTPQPIDRSGAASFSTLSFMHPVIGGRKR